jgi:transposase
MLTVDEYARIRRAHRDGMSIHEIARRHHHSRRKVREALAKPEPKPYTRIKAPTAPKLGRFKALIDEILAADEKAPRKQRHWATQIFRRLAKEGYEGGYDQVRRYVAKRRRREQETFIPLDHDPGQRVEADFGHIWVDFPEGRKRVPVLLLTWAFSYCPFAIALPTERNEAILHGMVEGFEFFGCVPKEVWWDNPTTVAVQILTGRQRLVNGRYAALASHYTFDPLFCMPARGNEKPHVENRVKCLQRRWATPVPKVRDLADLNAYLRRCCLEDRQRIAAGQTESIGQRFERDLAAALALPEHRFDACIDQPGKVDKYQTVAFDCNRYSVPRPYAFTTVTVKGYVERVEVVAEGRVVARHERCYERGHQILDPLHYLATLGRKPACLDHSAVYRHWKLPPSFLALRKELEAKHGSHPGARAFVRVLQLLREHPIERVAEAIEQTRQAEGPLVDLIVQRTEQLGRRQAESAFRLDPPEALPAVPHVEVPRPDLRRFNLLLSLGDQPYECQSHALVEEQPQAVATADHVCRV